LAEFLNPAGVGLTLDTYNFPCYNINFHANSGLGGECLNKYADIEPGVAQGGSQVRPMIGKDAA
jgi:hypothetical protein